MWVLNNDIEKLHRVIDSRSGGLKRTIILLLIVHKEEMASYIAMSIVALELYITPD